MHVSLLKTSSIWNWEETANSVRPLPEGASPHASGCRYHEGPGVHRRYGGQFVARQLLAVWLLCCHASFSVPALQKGPMWDLKGCPVDKGRSDLFFTGRNFLPEVCGEVHPETAPLQAVCCSLCSTEQSTFEVERGAKRCPEKGRNRGSQQRAQEGKKDAWKQVIDL